MNIILLGAGEIGKQLAYMFCNKENNIVVIDSSLKLLNRLRDKLDVMTIHGNCANFNVLLEAGIKDADILVSMTNDDVSNIFACQIAKSFNIKKTICRLSSNDYFSKKHGYTPATLGIDHLIFPED